MLEDFTDYDVAMYWIAQRLGMADPSKPFATGKGIVSSNTRESRASYAVLQAMIREGFFEHDAEEQRVKWKIRPWL